jgi:hypothetical protein
VIWKPSMASATAPTTPSSCAVGGGAIVVATSCEYLAATPATSDGTESG